MWDIDTPFIRFQDTLCVARNTTTMIQKTLKFKDFTHNTTYPVKMTDFLMCVGGEVFVNIEFMALRHLLYFHLLYGHLL